MCKVTQFPLLFTDCHHLMVVSTMEPCVETHVPSKPGLYCGPAEWEFITVAEVESHPARCRNCLSRSGEATFHKTESPGNSTETEDDDPYDFLPSASQIKPQPRAEQSQAAMTREEKPLAKGVSMNQKVTLEATKPVKEAKPVQSEKEPQQPQQAQRPKKEKEVKPLEDKMENDENLKKKAAEYGVSVAEYKEIVGECSAISKTRQSRVESRFDDEPSFSA